LVTKVIQWHLDTSFEDGGLLSSQVVVNADEVEAQIQGANEGLQRVTVLEDKVAQLAEENGVLTNRIDDLTGMVSRLEATTAGLRAKHDTPEATLAHAESTLKHVLIAVQDARGHAVNSGEPF
jgi:dynactin complex subunit